MVDTTANDRQVGGTHYGGGAYQHWDWAWDAHLDSFQYPITKYLARWKRKDGLKDLDKAHHYLVKYIEVVSREKSRRDEPSFTNFQRHKEWAQLEGLDNAQFRITGKIMSWVIIEELYETLGMLERYIDEQKGGPTPAYVNQD